MSGPGNAGALLEGAIARLVNPTAPAELVVIGGEEAEMAMDKVGGSKGKGRGRSRKKNPRQIIEMLLPAVMGAVDQYVTTYHSATIAQYAPPTAVRGVALVLLAFWAKKKKKPQLYGAAFALAAQEIPGLVADAWAWFEGMGDDAVQAVESGDAGMLGAQVNRQIAQEPAALPVRRRVQAGALAA